MGAGRVDGLPSAAEPYVQRCTEDPEDVDPKTVTIPPEHTFSQIRTVELADDLCLECWHGGPSRGRQIATYVSVVGGSDVAWRVSIACDARHRDLEVRETLINLHVSRLVLVPWCPAVPSGGDAWSLTRPSVQLGWLSLAEPSSSQPIRKCDTSPYTAGLQWFQCFSWSAVV